MLLILVINIIILLKPSLVLAHLVLFLFCHSDLYAGRSSDKQITNDCCTLDLLEAGDFFMADKGFEIADDLSQGVTLNIPPLKDHLSIEEETETRRIASVRIRVERAMARIKN